MSNIIQYIRDGRNQRIGVVVAIPTDDGFRLGWSVCNKRDKFDKAMAVELAIGRAMSGKKHAQPIRMVNRVISVPVKLDSFDEKLYVIKVDAVQEMINHVRSRALRYFRVKEAV